MESRQTVVSLRDVRFAWNPLSDPVLDIETFDMAQGEKVFLYGPSGSGKSTLLSIIAAVVQPQAGTVTVDGVDLGTLSGSALDRFRADHIGLVFQQFNLLPFLNILDNVALPCRFSTLRKQRAMESTGTLKDEAIRLLQTMQLPESAYQARSAMQLSVGQQQRVAVARALMGKPSLIIADEPTSSLDMDARTAFLELLFTEVESTNASVLFVSHDASLQSMFDRSIRLDELNAANPEQLVRSSA
ncbi:MAG: ABC transporter ATP-binding protein [Gammaproteobacteria bacterium]|nr:ABC transporter ATP-binding protein [Gammaproteobacteria bacterium]